MVILRSFQETHNQVKCRLKNIFFFKLFTNKIFELTFVSILVQQSIVCTYILILTGFNEQNFLLHKLIIAIRSLENLLQPIHHFLFYWKSIMCGFSTNTTKTMKNFFLLMTKLAFGPRRSKQQVHVQSTHTRSTAQAYRKKIEEMKWKWNDQNSF